HWLLDVVHSEGLVLSGEPAIDAHTPLGDAWRLVSQSCDITQAQLTARVAAHFHMSVADLATTQLRAIDLVPENLARKHHVFPLRETDHELVVAGSDPTDAEAEQLIGFVSGRTLVVEIAPPDAIQESLDARYAPDRVVERLLNRVGVEMAHEIRLEHEVTPESVAARDAASAPIIRLTNVILGDAVHARASDIHLEPIGDSGRVRFRVDGVLQPYTRLSMAILNRVVSCIKIMGKMDISDRLRPQDGRARIRVDGRSIDLRLSTVPTRESEKAVVRLLDPRNARRLEDLSLATGELEPLRALLAHRDGIVLVTGPTGSGKTTLLYAALREMPTDEINVMTVEDPIEYELPGLTQIQVEPKRDLTFANALRSILRQDPDVIFIGEIRDTETAKIAVQASLTGHLVLASLHTNDAVGSVARFSDLGVERGEIASTLRGATAQRLVRKICTKCAQTITGALTELEQRLAARYGVEPVVRAMGCPVCAGTGYYGRVPLLEIMVLNPALELGIIEGATASQLQSTALASGMRPLREAAAVHVRAGETTLEEIDRELGESDPQTTRTHVQPHILIAEDDAVTRMTAGALLTKNGFRVSEAGDGVAALDTLNAARDVSLLVLDLAMPRLSGQDVLRQLRGSVATSKLPVVVLTGSTDEHMEASMMDAGADDYVRKPIDPDRFISRIKATLRRAEH
ncbi:MAG TPA: ATPase, T2SS/T4P/T4SS family, partial [Gemmatimonadaceae bacterium]|nr:ATPase, T2SS/T4P/T4SS family [Gemmatimonadaceae bacterium]